MADKANRKEVPYKIILSEDEIPASWYNMRADMKNKPAPMLDPGTMEPVTEEALRHVFCDEAVRQELDNETRFIPIPEDIRNFYRMYRPAPLIQIGRAHV